MKYTLEEKMELNDLTLAKRRQLMKRNKGKETVKSLRLLKIAQKLGEK